MREEATRRERARCCPAVEGAVACGLSLPKPGQAPANPQGHSGRRQPGSPLPGAQGPPKDTTHSPSPPGHPLPQMLLLIALLLFKCKLNSHSHPSGNSWPALCSAQENLLELEGRCGGSRRPRGCVPPSHHLEAAQPDGRRLLTGWKTGGCRMKVSGSGSSFSAGDMGGGAPPTGGAGPDSREPGPLADSPSQLGS